MESAVDNPRFRVLEHLGSGGTADVASVFVADIGCQAALKYYRPNSDVSARSFSELIKREYSLIGGFHFPGLVRPLERPDRDGKYLLLELCLGPTLDRIGRVQDINLVLNLLSAIALDLEFLRVAGIVHGDLKPQNIFLPINWDRLPEGTLFYAKLSDFSLGKRTDESDAKRLGLGTVGYMAPETIADGVTTHQSDLFALGIIGYQLLSGIHPFFYNGSEPVEVNSRTREEEPVSLRSMRQDLAVDITELINTLLAKREGDRPESALAVCKRLHQLGATYPYQKGLRPGYVIGMDKSYNDNVSTILSLGDEEKHRLDLLSDRDTLALRLLLTSNFLRGNLRYDNGRFTFAGNIYWPVSCRRNLCRQFRLLSLSEKKRAIAAAVVGDLESARQIHAIPVHCLQNMPASLFVLLRSLLHSITIKRFSSRFSLAAERASLHSLAADLHIQAGALEGAERCAYQAATELKKNHRSDKTIAVLNKAIRYAALLDKRFFVRNLLMFRGDLHKENGDTRKALAAYRELIALYDGRPQDKLLAETYKDLGDLFRLQQDSAAGLKALERSQEIFQDLGDELEISHVLNNMGNIHWLTADTPKALGCYRQALRIQRRLDAKAKVASTLNNIGNVYGVQGRYTRCLRILNLSLSLKKEIGHAGEIARTLNNLGYAHYITGHAGKAVECLVESLKINRTIGSKKEILFNLENLTSIMITAGQLKQSLVYFRQSLELSASLNDKAHLGTVHGSMAKVFKRMGRFAEAEHSLEKAEQCVKKIDYRLLEVTLRVGRAGLRYALGDYPVAYELAIQALDEAHEAKDSECELNALLLITKLTDKPEYVERTEKLTDELHVTREKRLLHFNQLEYYLEHKMIGKAERSACKLKEIPLTIAEDIELAWMCNLLGEIFLEIGEADVAEPHIRMALSAAQTSGLTPEMVVALMLNGRMQIQRGEYEDCFSDYKKSLYLCKRIVDSIPADIDRQRYQNRRSILFLAREIRRLGQLLTKKERAG